MHTAACARPEKVAGLNAAAVGFGDESNSKRERVGVDLLADCMSNDNYSQ